MAQDRTAGGEAPRPATARLYAALPLELDFEDAVAAGRATPLPGDWVLGVADVATSARELEGGRYKAVNTAGAAVVSAVSNALGTLDFPFVFAGDGASFAVAPADAPRAAAALAATVAWAGAELGLALRGAAVAVDAVRAAGADLRVARVAASDHVAYAMFTGGGRDWAEREMKAGRLSLPPAPAGARPDLSGLSCRFRPVAAARGIVLSVIVKPVGDARAPGFVAACADVLALARAAPRGGHPVPAAGPAHHWPPHGFDIEARTARRGGGLGASRLRVALRSAVDTAVLRAGWRVGGVVPADYRRRIAENSDFRKFDDGLMMTLDCSPAEADAIEGRLAAAEAAGEARFGLHRQAEALVTCVVPSAARPDHVHFVDGASGGYAAAAAALKRRDAVRAGGLARLSAERRPGEAG